jgi:C-terminal processing protease CtpA/Prc
MALADFAAGVIKAVEESKAERLVIDMRFNGGGNTGLLPPLLLGLIKSERINQPGRLFVIIGRHTFSAAQNCVNMMEDTMNVTFVGEPTGSCPAFIGESTFFVLPYSKLRVTCSSRYWQWGDSTDRRVWVQPQIAAPPTFAAYAAGKDDAMEAILAAIGAPAEGAQGAR